MEYCPSNETKSGNPYFELNIKKYNSTACSHTAKIKGSLFFTPPPPSVTEAEYVSQGKQDQTGLDRSARSTLDFGVNTVERYT